LAEFRAVSRFRPSGVRAAACALAAAFVLLLGTPPAQAQSAVTLVSNTDHVSGTASNLFLAQSFTTGDQGATVTAIRLQLGARGAANPRISVKLREDNAGTPGDLVATFTNPATLTGNALNTFNAPPNTVLAAGTTYWVSINEGISNRQHVRNASSNDQSGEAGWTIGDGRKFRNNESSNWSDSSQVVVFAIVGTLPAAPEAGKRVLERTLASVASRTVSGALDTLGGRMGEAVPASSLSLAGLNLAGPNPAGPDDAWPSGSDSRGMTPDALLGSGAFSYTLGAAAGDKAADPKAPRWGIWGRGDFGTFAGRSGDGPDGGSRHDGDLRTGWLGADARGARGSGRWVAGLAVSRGTSETNYVLDGEEGRIETDLTALWPYGRWTFPNGLEMRGLLGVGRGEARHRTGDGEPEKSDLSMWAASAGLSRPLPPIGGIDLSARGDASVAFMETAYGDGAVDGLDAAVSRVRGGVEASKRFAMADGASLTPFAELAGRMDGGDGGTGPGIEVAGGVRYAGPRVAVEVRGRWLAAHTEAGAEERGVSLTARMQPGAYGRGLSMSLSPRWGAGTGGPLGGTSALWREELPRGAPGAGAPETGALDLRVGYGFGLGGGRLTGTPNIGFGASDGGRDYRAGWRLTPAVRGHPGFEVNLDATRSEPAGAGAPAHGAMLTGAIRW